MQHVSTHYQAHTHPVHNIHVVQACQWVRFGYNIIRFISDLTDNIQSDLIRESDRYIQNTKKYPTLLQEGYPIRKLKNYRSQHNFNQILLLYQILYYKCAIIYIHTYINVYICRMDHKWIGLVYIHIRFGSNSNKQIKFPYQIRLIEPDSRRNLIH